MTLSLKKFISRGLNFHEKLNFEFEFVPMAGIEKTP
jgi:hypothetical protein